MDKSLLVKKRLKVIWGFTSWVSQALIMQTTIYIGESKGLKGSGPLLYKQIWLPGSYSKTRCKGLIITTNALIKIKSYFVVQ